MITPQEIETKAFKMSFRGYSPAEVDDFLQEICDSYLEIYTENKKIREQSQRLSQAVGQYKSMEDTLTDAVSIAGRSAEEIENDANQKAEAIIRNAELTAESIIAGAEQKIAAEAYRLESIKREVEIYKAKIIELLNAQLSVLKGYPQSGSIETEPERVHSQQLWKKKADDTEKPTEKAETIEKVEKVEEKPAEKEQDIDATQPYDSIEDFDKTADLGEITEPETSELPCVSLNDDGEYVVSNQSCNN